MPEQTLLVGNGPNRLSHDTYSWDAVLQRLAAFTGKAELFSQRSNKPFTLLFEEMALQASACGVSERDLKVKVAEWMQNLPGNWIHQALLALPGRHLLTTNYDYALEGTQRGERVDLSSETRYSLFRCREVGCKRVWHLHGEIERPATITLGYEQYIGHLYKIRNYISLESFRPIAGPYDYRSPVMHRRYNFEERTDGVFSWVDIFLRDDIHIVGFSLDYSESDLWWLLGLKERLRQQDQRLAKGIEVGRTVFYDFKSPHESSKKLAHLSALRNFNVEVCQIAVGQHYEGAWNKLVERLQAVI